MKNKWIIGIICICFIFTSVNLNGEELKNDNTAIESVMIGEGDPFISAEIETDKKLEFRICSRNSLDPSDNKWSEYFTSDSLKKLILKQNILTGEKEFVVEFYFPGFGATWIHIRNIKNLISDLSEKLEINTEEEKKIKRINELNSELSMKNTELEKELNVMAGKFNKLIEENNVLKFKYKTLAAKKHFNEKEVAGLKNNTENLNEILMKLREENEDYKYSVKNLKNQNSKLEKKIKSDFNEIEVLKRERTSLINKLIEMDNAKKQNNEMKNIKLRKSIDEKNREIEVLNKKLKIAVLSYEEMKTSLLEITDKHRELVEKYTDEAIENKKNIKIVTELEMELKNRKNEIDRLRKLDSEKFQKYENEIKQMKQRLVEYKKIKKKLTEEDEATLREFRNEKEILEGRILLLTKDIEVYKNRNSENENRIKKLVSEKESLRLLNEEAAKEILELKKMEEARVNTPVKNSGINVDLNSVIEKFEKNRYFSFEVENTIQVREDYFFDENLRKIKDGRTSDFILLIKTINEIVLSNSRINEIEIQVNSSRGKTSSARISSSFMRHGELMNTINNMDESVLKGKTEFLDKLKISIPVSDDKELVSRGYIIFKFK